MLFVGYLVEDEDEDEVSLIPPAEAKIKWLGVHLRSMCIL